MIFIVVEICNGFMMVCILMCVDTIQDNNCYIVIVVNGHYFDCGIDNGVVKSRMAKDG